MQTLSLQLNADGVASPAMVAATTAMHVVSHFLVALEKEDLDQATGAADTIGYNFRFKDVSSAELKEIYLNWLLAKGFQGLAQGVRESLEEAFFYLQCLQMAANGPRRTTWGEVDDELAAIRKRASTFNFTQLLSAVNAQLAHPLSFEAEFLAMQKVRNCLEHRRGRVTERDLDPGQGELILSFPRLKVFFKRGEDEIELAPGVIVDTHEVLPPEIRSEPEVPIFAKREIRLKSYRLGERIRFSVSEFNEICAACHFFAVDLASKLPVA